ncbi:MAG: hypothetical protein JJU02_14785, partial [Cryomorphaceae bacterium]|nr:hypothetical protein [Cryomorphaceae bacterium]
MKTSTSERLSAFLLIFLFLSNDLLATAYSFVYFPKDIGKQEIPARNFDFIQFTENRQTAKKLADSQSVIEEKDEKLEVNETDAVQTSNNSSKLSPPSKANQNERYVFPSSDHHGVIGRGEKDPLGNPSDDIFSVYIQDDLDLKAFTGAYLKYNISGLEDGRAIAKSINQGKTFGTLDYKKSHKNSITIEAIQVEDLRSGKNMIRFSLPSNVSLEAEISNLSIHLVEDKEFSAPNYLFLKKVEEPSLVFVSENKKEMPVFGLRDIQAPAIPSNIVNVTKGAPSYGFYLGEVEDGSFIGIGIDKSKIPPSYTMENVKTYFFDYNDRKWTAIDVDSIGVGENGDLNYVPYVAATEYFNGIIKSPEMPEANAFMPTSMQDIQPANPAAEMNIMQPPSISQTGEASINYPLTIPQGRNGMTPSLSLSYSSDGGSSWVGVGWNISFPMVSVETKWGVPEFDEEYESESYIFEGSSLTMQGDEAGYKPHRGNAPEQAPSLLPRSGSEKRFFPKQMNRYQEITRNGDIPMNYVWIKTTADQTKYYFGTEDGNSVDDDAVLRDDNDNIVEWYLKKVEDKWGNNITYNYKTIIVNSQNPVIHDARATVIQSIFYTGFGSSPGKYSIHFNTINNRNDALINNKYGFKKADYFELDEIEIKYDNSTIIRSFDFQYTTGAFQKQLLSKVAEYRNSTLFFEHEFEYFEENITYQQGDIDEFSDNLLSRSDAVNQETSVLLSVLFSSDKISPLNSSVQTGFDVSGFVGAGIAPITETISPNKKFALGGTTGYGENSTIGKSNFLDVNGDGIPDIVFKNQQGQLRFIPLILNSNGELTVGAEKQMQNRTEFFESFTNRNEYGVQGNVPFAYGGMNWSNSRSKTETYFVDYNNDGINDIASNGNIYFGNLKSDGNVEYILNSQTTPNPVFLGNVPTLPEPEDDDKFVEIVKTWKAPFDGEISIQGQANLSSQSDDGVSIAIQHNDEFIQGCTFADINPGNNLNLGNTINVVKGDMILFRAKCKSNGYGDLVEWDPYIFYTGMNLIDANNIKYSENKYSEGFLLSQNEQIPFTESGNYKITWPSLSLTETDEVTFKVIVEFLDEDHEIISSEIHQQTSTANQSYQVELSLMDNGSSQNDDLFSSSGRNISIRSDELVKIYFEVESSSNVNWADINWRPSIEYQVSGISDSYNPVIHYKTFNSIYKFDGGTNLAGMTFNEPECQIYPKFDSQISNYLSSLGSDEARAYFTVKVKDKLVSKLELLFEQSGITYIDRDGNFLSLGQYSDLQEIDVNEIETLRLHVEFFTDDEDLANVLTEYSSYDIFDVDNGSLIFWRNFEEVNVFKHNQNSFTGPDYLGWGQFAWLVNNQDEIPISSIDMVDITQHGITSEFDENMTYQDMQDITDLIGLNFDNIESLPLVPQRTEKILNLPFKIRGEVIDRWSALGTKNAATKNKFIPGRLYEKVTPSSSPSQPSYSATSAFAPKKHMKSYSKAYSGGASLMGMPLPKLSLDLGFSIYHNQNPGNSFGISTNVDFMDLNGDGYPDVLTYFNNETQIGLTNQSGGFNPLSVYSSANELPLMFEKKAGLVFGGSYGNQSAGSTAIQVPANFLGDNYSSSEILWIDINADGLPDKLIKDQGNLKVCFNMGHSLSSPVLIPTSAQTLDNNIQGGYALSAAAALGFGSWVNGSIRAGFMRNKIINEGKTSFADINGDGLIDHIIFDGENLFVFLNTGTGYTSIPYNLPGTFNTDEKLSKNITSAFSAQIGATVSVLITPVPIPPPPSPPAFGVKGSVGASLGTNAGISNTEMMVMDINGDGCADFLTIDENKITYYLSNAAKSNLLKTVKTPLKSEFSIDYKREGNKYGEYPRKVHTGTVTPKIGESDVLWDMPHSKWVMSSLEVFDGYDISGANDANDGEDYYTMEFVYDGGIYSRREREFLGFTLTESKIFINDEVPTITYESPQPITPLNHISMHTSKINEYLAPLSNGFIDRIDYEYMRGVLINEYTLNHFSYLLDVVPPEIIDSFHVAEIINHEYNFYKVELDPASGLFNRVNFSEEINSMGSNEVSCFFPALKKTHTYTFPEFYSLGYFYHGYETKYDSYFNITEVFDHRQDFPQEASWITIGSIPTDPPEDVDQLTVTQPPTEVGIIALMDYFSPTQAADQTNLIKSHSIYTELISPPNLQRHSTVEDLHNFLAPSKIANHLTTSDISYTDLEYDNKGNVTSIIRPENHVAQRLTTDFLYDSEVEQFVTQVSNSYGDVSCMSYIYETGQIQSVTDPNGFITFYKYDDFNRLQQVFSPREFINPNAPFTIEFEYFPFGMDPQSSDLRERIPVAVSTHFLPTDMPEEPELLDDGGTLNCFNPQLPARESPLLTNDMIQTAVFIDGMQRTIQTKQDVSKFNTNTKLNEKTHLVSGLQTYDFRGLVKELRNPINESGSTDIRIFNTDFSAVLQFEILYDQLGRKYEIMQEAVNNAVAAKHQTNLRYKWIEHDNSWYFGNHIIENAGPSSFSTGDMEVLNLHNAQGNLIFGMKLKNGTINSDAIITTYSYDRLNQLLSTQNPIGEETEYEYDRFGRVAKEIHPDLGISDFIFDDAGNLIAIENGNGVIQLSYFHNRLIEKTLPSSNNINGVIYTYGSYQDGRNGAGRIISVLQGEDLLEDHYYYDELGNRIREDRKIAIPRIGEITFRTQYAFDSQGRIRKLIQPDSEVVTYFYSEAGGELESVHYESSIHNINPTVGSPEEAITPYVPSPGFAQNPYDYVSKIGYDGYGAAQYMMYGNSVLTELDYYQGSRQLANVNITRIGDGHDVGMLNKDIEYFKNGNVKKIENIEEPFSSCSHSQVSWKMGGTYNHTYQYDFANRLKGSVAQWNGQESGSGQPLTHDFTLNMEYDEVGRILAKDQTHLRNSTVPAELQYSLEYVYDGQKQHQIDNIFEDGVEHFYEYNSRGSVTGIYIVQDEPKIYIEQYAWDDQDRLQGAKNNYGNSIHHNVYDPHGTRLMKSSAIHGAVWINGIIQEGNDDWSVKPYTIYVNPHYICTYYPNEVTDVTKHYYAGSQRVATALYHAYYKYPGDDPGMEGMEGFGGESQTMSSAPPLVENNIVLTDLERLLGVFGDDVNAGHFTQYDFSTFDAPDLHESEYCHFDPDCGEFMLTPNTPNQLEEYNCICRENPSAGGHEYPAQCRIHTDVYWYHPDYLGNTEFVTDIGGYPYQHLFYSPFGEAIVSQ